MSDPTLLVLSSFAGGDEHGYATMQDIERFAGVLKPSANISLAAGRVVRTGLRRLENA